MSSQLKTIAKLTNKIEEDVRLLWFSNKGQFWGEYFFGKAPIGFELNKEANPEVYILTLINRRVRATEEFENIARSPKNKKVKAALEVTESMKEVEKGLLEVLETIHQASKAERGEFDA